MSTVRPASLPLHSATADPFPSPLHPFDSSPPRGSHHRPYPINIGKTHTALSVAIAVTAGTGVRIRVGVDGTLRI